MGTACAVASPAEWPVGRIPPPPAMSVGRPAPLSPDTFPLGDHDLCPAPCPVPSWRDAPRPPGYAESWELLGGWLYSFSRCEAAGFSTCDRRTVVPGSRWKDTERTDSRRGAVKPAALPSGAQSLTPLLPRSPACPPLLASWTGSDLRQLWVGQPAAPEPHPCLPFLQTPGPASGHLLLWFSPVGPIHWRCFFCRPGRRTGKHVRQ